MLCFAVLISVQQSRVLNCCSCWCNRCDVVNDVSKVMRDGLDRVGRLRWRKIRVRDEE